MALSGIVSRATSGLDQREIRDVLEGHLTLEHKPTFKYVRIFLSSNETDSEWERKHLRSNVFPRLRQFCQSLGLQFHVVDFHHNPPTSLEMRAKMRRDEKEDKGDGVFYYSDPQQLLQLTLWEIRACQDMSPGPTFVTLLAQKYGHKPPPAYIPAEEYSQLCAVMEDSASARELVQQSYKLDTNAVPPQYALQQSLKHDDDWKEKQDILSRTIAKASRVALGKDASKVQKYIMSVSEEEVSVGIFQLKADPNRCCLWSKRTFTDLLDQKPHYPALPLFTDVTMGKKGLEFDIEAIKSLNHLKEARLPAKYIGLDASNIFEFSLKWEKNKGLDPEQCPSHAQYLSEISEKMTGTIEQQITEAAHILQLQSSSRTYQEVLAHGAHCKEIVTKAMDRPDILAKIQSYLDGPCANPLVVHGPTGYGKTVVVALTAYRLRERNPVKNMAIVLRFLGLTPHSRSIFHTLRSISEQIATVYDEDDALVPGDYQGVSNHFMKSLSNASEGRPLFLFLDGVDQLSPEDGATGMSWLPLSLPPHVKLMLSTSSEVEYRCFPVLQSLLAMLPGNFVQVPVLSTSLCHRMLLHCLASEKRQLTPQQLKVAVGVLEQCPVPLFLQLMLQEFKHWRSYTEVQTTFATSIEGAINSLFTSLESKYGSVLISHLLGYVTASKHGLTEPEILDILALDEEVMAEVNSNIGSEESKPILTLPPIIWSQIRHQLHPLLELKVGIDNYLLLQWSHRRLREIADIRYLSSEIYESLATYFMGSTEKKETDETLSEAPTLSRDTQPLVLNEVESLFNIRKLTELPHSLARSGQYEKLKELLSDYQWLKASILTLPCRDIIQHFAAVIPTVPICKHSTASDHELRLLQQTLSYSTNVLNVDRTQFSTQLAGRLLHCIRYSSENPILKALVTAALQDVKPALTPLQSLTFIPGGPELVCMEGHRDTVSCIATALVQSAVRASLTIVSSSWDRSLKSWDLESTGVLKTFDGHGGKVLSVALSSDGLYAASGSQDTTVRYWYVPTADCLYILKGHLAAVNAVAITTNGSKTISASSDCTIKVWKTDLNSSSSGKIIYTLRSINRPVMSLILMEEVLVSGTNAGKIFFTNIISGNQLKMFQGHTGGVTALASETVNSCCYLVSGSTNGGLKVWDFNTCSLVYTLLSGGNDQSAITSVSIGPNGNIIASNGERKIKLWDATSGLYLHSLSGHTGAVYSIAITDEGKLAITGSADHSLRIWNILSTPVPHTTKLHSVDITAIITTACGSFGASASKDGRVCVFETDSMTVLQELQPHSTTVNQLLVYKDTSKILSASTDGTISLWNGETGEILLTFDNQGSPINCLAVTATKELLMSGGEGGEVVFWSTETGRKLKSFSDHSTGVLTVAFIRQEGAQFMFSCSKSGEFCIREFKTAKTVVSTELHSRELLCASLAPNSNSVVCGSADNAAYVVSLPLCSLTAVLSGHSAAVKAVKVFPDSTKCITGSLDSTIRVWDTVNGESLAVLCVDQPILACDCRNMIILYGTEGGWVSSAAYEPDISRPNALLSKLDDNDGNSVTSLSTSSKSTLGSKTEIVPSQQDKEIDLKHETTNDNDPLNVTHNTSDSHENAIPSTDQLILDPEGSKESSSNLHTSSHSKLEEQQYSNKFLTELGPDDDVPSTHDEKNMRTVNSVITSKRSQTPESSMCLIL